MPCEVAPFLILYPYSISHAPAARCKGLPVTHTLKGKTKLLNRVRRIKGQVEAIERALEAEADCAEVMQQITSCREP